VTDTVALFCSWCGGETAPDDPARPADEAHEKCRARLARVDPPRYCPECGRRMVVQVDPMGWTARCSRHGETSSADRAQR
jgi:rRNA maturation protein Nop10